MSSIDTLTALLQSGNFPEPYTEMFQALISAIGGTVDLNGSKVRTNISDEVVNYLEDKLVAGGSIQLQVVGTTDKQIEITALDIEGNPINDEKVKASISDVAGYLDSKVDNSTIEVSGNKLKIVQSVLDAKADLSGGVVPIGQLPPEAKREIKVVADIAERDLLVVYEGLRVHVEDATADSSVDSGWAEYLWNGTAFSKTAENESIDIVLDWANVQNKPSSYPPSTHGHTASEVSEEANKKFMTDAERTKLSGVADNANNYSHPATHNPSIIQQDVNNRFVSDSEKTNWNNKLDATAKAADSEKLDGWDSTGYAVGKRVFEGDLNTLFSNGLYRINSTSTNIPVLGRYYALICFGNGGNVTGQLATDYQTGETYIRAYNSSWSTWRKLWDNQNDVYLVTKAKIEAVLTGEITSHTHPEGTGSAFGDPEVEKILIAEYGQIVSVSYNGDGTINIITYANSITKTHTYNADGSVATEVWKENGTAFRTFTYTYNTDGSVKTRSVA